MKVTLQSLSLHVLCSINSVIIIINTCSYSSDDDDGDDVITALIKQLS